MYIQVVLIIAETFGYIYKIFGRNKTNEADKSLLLTWTDSINQEHKTPVVQKEYLTRNQGFVAHLIWNRPQMCIYLSISFANQ